MGRNARTTPSLVLSIGAVLCFAFSMCVYADGHVETVSIASDYQNGPQEITVLTPDTYSPDKKYRVLYLLPVTAQGDGNFGEMILLDIFRKLDIQNRYDLIIVRATFEKAPWFGDHVSDPKMRQSSYMKEFLVPYVEKHYSTLGTAEGRLLIGFSKSGWGGLSLLLRDPDFYGYAAVWDAPYLLQHLDFNMQEIFGTDEQMAKYRPDLLVVSQKQFFQGKARIVLGGESLFGTIKGDGKDHLVEMHNLLTANGIQHVYLPDLKFPHGWDARWVDPMVAEMMKLADPSHSE